MRKLSIGVLLSLTLFVIVAGLIAQAQKDDAAEEGVTLAQLGVSEEQKTQIKALWELKRQAHIQALSDLKILNRLARDQASAEHKIEETLATIRQQRLTKKKEIQTAEESLIESLPVRAQLHLTILGVLDNGLTRRIGRGRTREGGEASKTKADGVRESGRE
ncbi:MAG: hypothetical protein OXN17_15160 [Candidatus Poribacteria bacterium]|nr:hypothetical protein [Candidatus Poribacteria bacterium]MDE0506003.1 hypothetical protein [Candidatus Poribacteria bacterium]